MSLGTGADRDDSIDRVLQQQMRHRSVTPAGPCLDAERVAAWAEGSLPPAEAADIERHAADCPRCQALLAAFAVTEPAPARAQVLAFRRLRWAVPIAAAALAAAWLFWIVAPRNRQTPPPATTVARVESPAAVPAPAAQVGEPPSQAAAPRRDTVQSKTAPQPESSASQTNHPDDLLTPAPVEGRDMFGMLKTLPGVVDPSASRDFAQWASGRSLSINGGLSLNKNTTIDGVPSGEEGGNGITHITPNIDSVAEVNRTEAEAAKATIQTAPTSPAAPPRTAASPVAGGAARGRDAFGSLRILPPVVASEFSSPAAGPGSPVARWRVFSDGHVEHSSGGQAWQRVALDSPVSVTTGAAPNPLVCWLVGRRGTVLVSVDGGEHFSRVDVPNPLDLSAIRAVDARNATVTTPDGRTFATSDAGRSWH